MTTIRFSAEDLDLFSSASHDRNPLHGSDEYARRTAYGSRVVFGVLTTLTALGHTGVMKRGGYVLSSIECEFFDVALLAVDYRVEVVEEMPSQTIVRVGDGRRPLLEVILTFCPGQPHGFVQLDEDPLLLSEPKNPQRADLINGYRLSGRYAANSRDMPTLRAGTTLQQSWASAREVSALLWASYLVGMELPGRRALFSRLLIEFQPSVHASAPFDYEAEIVEVSDAGELTLQARLSSGGKVWAKAHLGAYLREDLSPATTADIEKLVGSSESLAGKVAFISGGSRGLGAALVRVLALHGCTVITNFLNSQAEAELLRDEIKQTSGRVLLEQGDVRDVTWCLELHQRLTSTVQRLDFLVCNASPALLPLWLEPAAATRINEFVTKSLAMVTTPVAALMPLVAESKGWNVLISSTAVTQMHPYFPHYVIAKSAAEAVVRAAATEYRTASSLIVRPARLLTDLTNTPLGRKGAISPELVAASILHRLQQTPCPGKVEVLDQFPSMTARPAAKTQVPC